MGKRFDLLSRAKGFAGHKQRFVMALGPSWPTVKLELLLLLSRCRRPTKGRRTAGQLLDAAAVIFGLDPLVRRRAKYRKRFHVPKFRPFGPMSGQTRRPALEMLVWSLAGLSAGILRRFFDVDFSDGRQ